MPPSIPRVDPSNGKPDICIILNPGSGKDRPDVQERLDAAMERHPGRFVLRVIRKGGNPTKEAEQAASDGFGTLVAAGGDGTISAVAAVAQGHGLTLGAIPMGTFNYFARGLDLPEGIDDAIDLIANGSTRPVPVGAVNGELFLNNASLGLYPAILAQREGIYSRWGRSRIAAHWSVLATVARFHRPLHLYLTVDGEPLDRRSPLVFVARSAYQLEMFGLVGADDVRAGRFAIFLVPDVGRWGLFRVALRLATHAIARGRDFDYVTGREVVIETKAKRRLVARDGERAKMSSPFRFSMLDDDLQVIAPGGGAR